MGWPYSPPPYTSACDGSKSYYGIDKNGDGTEEFALASERAVDFNGDGLPEHVVTPPGASNGLTFALNTGHPNSIGDSGHVEMQHRDAVVVDSDGDNLQELMFPLSSVRWKGPAEDQGLSTDTTMQSPFQKSGTVRDDSGPHNVYGVVVTGDFDGDGTKDLFNTGDPTDPEAWGIHPTNFNYLPDQHTLVHYSLGKNTAKAGLLRSVTDGLGKRTTIHYAASIAETIGEAVYSPDGCFNARRKTSKCAKMIGPIVESHGEEQLFGGVSNPGPSYSYTYRGARRGVGERKWFAFKKRKIAGPLSTTEIEYYTDADAGESDTFGANRFLIIGKVKKAETTNNFPVAPPSAFSSAIATRVQTQTNVYSLDPGATFAYLSSQSTTVSEGSVGSPTPLTSTTWQVNALDASGFVTNEETKVSAGATQTADTITIRVITNNIPLWRIGQVDSETVTSTIGGRSSPRVVAYGYDAKGRLETIERETPASSASASNPYLKTKFTRDAYGNVDSTTLSDSQAVGATSRQVFAVAQWEPLHFWPTVVEDAMGHPVALTIAPATGQLTSSTDANLVTSSFLYDSFGRLTYSNTPGGISKTEYLVTSPGQEIVSVWGAIQALTTAQGGGNSSVSYDAFGRVVRKVDQGVDALVAQAFEYDSFGRLVREARPHQLFSAGVSDLREGIVTYAYSGPLMTSATLPDGNTVKYRRVDRNSAIGAAAGWFSSPEATSGTVVVDPRGSISATIVNPSGLPVLRATGSAAAADLVTYGYGPFGTPLSVSGPGGTTTIVPDVLGRPESVTDPATGTTTTIYNGFGEPVQQTSANHITTHSYYDALGRPTAIKGTGEETIAKWTYDGDGNRPNEIGRLIASYRQSAPHSSTGTWQQYRYQGAATLGMLESVTYGINGDETVPGSGETYKIAYQYTDPGALWRTTGITYPQAPDGAFAVGLQYSESGALVAVTTPDSTFKYWELVSTDQGMRPALERFGNGVQTSYDYYHLDATGTPVCIGEIISTSCMPGLLKGLRVQKGASPTATPYLSPIYSYDGNQSLYTKSQSGNPGTSPDITHVYAYDDQDRLTEDRTIETTSGGSTIVGSDSFTYDSAGNLTSKTGVGSYVYDIPGKPFQVHTAGSDLTYTWGDSGNLLTRTGPASLVPGGQQVFDYDDLNLPYRITSGTGTGQTRAEFEYDATGARVVKRTLEDPGGAKRVKFVTLDIGELYQQVREYDPTSGNVIAKEHHFRVFAGGKQVLEIIKPENGSGAIDNANIEFRYLHQDHLGSGVVATDALGDVAEQQEFDAFGSKKSGSWNYAKANSGFTGHQHDADLGLVNMRGRLYDAKLGRFTKADPFVTDPMSAGGLNRYSYVGNNPLKYVDPSGFEGNWLDWTISIITLVPVVLINDGGEPASQTGDGGFDMGTGPTGGGTACDAGPGGCSGGRSKATPRAAPSAGAAPAPATAQPVTQGLALAAPSEEVHGPQAARDPVINSCSFGQCTADIWLEGATAGEPELHLSVSIGDPNGKYESFSFAVGENKIGADFGKVYQDRSGPGQILEYIKTDLSQDAQARRYIYEQWQADSRPTYGFEICRSYALDKMRIFRIMFANPTQVPAEFQRIAPPTTRPWWERVFNWISGGVSSSGSGTSQ